MNENWMKIIEIIATLIGIAIARYALPWLKASVQQIKQSDTTEKVQELIRWAEKAVLWAQQVYYDQSGEFRRNAVEQFLMAIVEDQGINITPEQIDILIEAAVKAMKIEEAKAPGGK